MLTPLADAGAPSDAELEAGILGAIKMGLASVAETLGAQLRARQLARAGIPSLDELRARPKRRQ
jgi:hypothetical protein